MQAACDCCYVQVCSLPAASSHACLRQRSPSSTPRRRTPLGHTLRCATGARRKSVFLFVSHKIALRQTLADGGSADSAVLDFSMRPDLCAEIPSQYGQAVPAKWSVHRCTRGQLRNADSCASAAVPELDHASSPQRARTRIGGALCCARSARTMRQTFCSAL
jgi:hypothetical protein